MPQVLTFTPPPGLSIPVYATHSSPTSDSASAPGGPVSVGSVGTADNGIPTANAINGLFGIPAAFGPWLLIPLALWFMLRKK